MDMSMLIKRFVITIGLIVLTISSIYSLSIKNKVDEFENNEIKTLKYKEFDLIDYLPHANGSAFLYYNNDTVVEFAILAFYTSMYKETYHFIFCENKVLGYLERTSYEEPYQIEGAKIEVIDEFEYLQNAINKDNSKNKKYIQFVNSLIEEL